MKFNSSLDDPTTFFNQAIQGFFSIKQRLDKNPLKALIEFYICIDPFSRSQLTEKERNYLLKNWPLMNAFL
ncbi:hypothetical protein COU56_00610 [Candidatus Pacearchaeota archaeon CG10_big_fil_rev_8_21_14_0_10_31_9]|nr:MAG: hypothetical protein AUJ62_02795 [Candidatus Pacearchaeota archaeon CG1_02_32_21]PIN95836.1 MAG: hypothetical protein COU56_00610 [Candidatus Pacearchaeota archaeon CG10_big_fil_rev_8_21_14_0_10_31_9]PIZ82513.1 MAG: hypothetical protein COX97_04445 [Candidatus Pacearchaeota archaeon CG_4_10_14_0_2_um_filter_05_32_18]